MHSDSLNNLAFKKSLEDLSNLYYMEGKMRDLEDKERKKP
jgi:hypothetical protein